MVDSLWKVPDGHLRAVTKGRELTESDNGMFVGQKVEVEEIISGRV